MPECGEQSRGVLATARADTAIFALCKALFCLEIPKTTTAL